MKFKIKGKEHLVPIWSDETLNALANLQKFDFEKSFKQIEKEEEEKKIEEELSSSGCIIRMVIFSLLTIAWIVFCVYCIVNNWTFSHWFDYIKAVIMMILGFFICVGMAYYVICWMFGLTDDHE